jgi:hypothetical protein
MRRQRRRLRSRAVPLLAKEQLERPICCEAWGLMEPRCLLTFITADDARPFVKHVN